ncbi:alpha/beta hydrolase [Nonomuraea sp. NPDC049607]|uniref:alpha/beta hydrolase n=1 Tax=Nonomuraea sp. NPDC049607 TaxID=3154732 RepID=UPI003440426D
MASLRNRLLAALVTASVALPASGAGGSAGVPAPVPAAVAPLRAATPAALAERYAAGRTAVLAAEHTAAARGHHLRAAALRAMADPSRTFLSFDGRDGGRTVEVFGDLATARRIAVLVPGSDTNLDRYGLLRAGATRLREALGDGSAVVAWAGYRTPSTLSLDVLTPTRADEAVPGLRAFVRELRALKPDARLSLVCHSYGSVVCGRAAPGLDVADIVLMGSPGAGVPDVAAMRTRAAVWAGRGGGDWIGGVPHALVELPFVTFGLGADPVSPGFGARVFPAGDGGHSDYLRPGSPALTAVVRIVSGKAAHDG